MLNTDGQPTNVAFNYKANLTKAACSLKGILHGITADNKISDIEIQFLQLWLDQQQNKTGDILDLYHDVNNLISKKNASQEEIDDLNNLIFDCIEYGPDMESEKDLINQFLGFIKGISVDDIIKLSEFENLIIELKKLSPLRNTFPVNKIWDRVEDILEDNVIEKSELEDLCELLKEICGTDFTSTGDAIGGATSFFNEQIQGSIDGLNICLTGKFIEGSRTKIQQIIEQNGGVFENRLNQKIDLLVIGTLESRDWLHNSSGKKIQLAEKFQQKGCQIKIISEANFFEAINN